MISKNEKLIDNKADVDNLDYKGRPALYSAIESEVLPAIHMLHQTTKGLQTCITQIAKANSLVISDGIEQFIKERLKLASDLFLDCLKECVKFGNVRILNLLVGKNKENENFNHKKSFQLFYSSRYIGYKTPRYFLQIMFHIQRSKT